MLAILKIHKDMEKVLIYIKMEINIKVNGKMMKKMVLGNIISKMEISTKESSNKVKKKDMENCKLKMESIKDNFQMI